MSYPDIENVTRFIFPFIEILFLIIIKFLYDGRNRIIAVCEKYTDNTQDNNSLNTMKNSLLNPAYISIMKLFQNFRTSTSNDISKDNLIHKYTDIYQHLIACDYLKKKVTIDDFKKEVDFLNIHKYVEQTIDWRGVTPEKLVLTPNWKDSISESYRLFSIAMRSIHKNQNLDSRKRIFDNSFRCSVLTGVIVLIIAIIFSIFAPDIQLFSMNCSSSCFIVGLIIFILSIVFLIGLERTQTALEEVYSDATKDNV